MPNRPAPGSSRRSSGGGDSQLGAAIFGGPALNADFGKEPVEGGPVSKYGADRLYQDPTLMQRIFNPRGVDDATRQQAAMNVNQMISKLDSARQLQNAIALQKIGHTNALDLQQIQEDARKDAVLGTAVEQGIIRKEAFADARMLNSEQEQLKKEGETRKNDREDLLSKRKDLDAGRALYSVLGRTPAFANNIIPAPLETPTDDMLAQYGRAASAYGGTDMGQAGAGQVVTKQNALNAQNTLAATPAWLAALLAAKQKEGSTLVGAGDYLHQFNPNLAPVTGGFKSQVSTPSSIPGAPPTLSDQWNAAKVGLPANEQAAKVAAAIAAGEATTRSPISKPFEAAAAAARQKQLDAERTIENVGVKGKLMDFGTAMFSGDNPNSIWNNPYVPIIPGIASLTPFTPQNDRMISKLQEWIYGKAGKPASR